MLISEMVTLFEGYDNKYKYDVITIAISNQEHSEKIQQLCFDNDIEWCHTGSVKFIVFTLPNYCFDICLKNRKMYLNPIADGSVNISHWLGLGQSIDPKLYKEEDYDRINHIIKYGSDVPTYTPREFNRKIDEQLITEGIDEIRNTNYFTKYNSLIITFDRNMNPNDYDYVSDVLYHKFGHRLGNYLDHASEDKFYVYFQLINDRNFIGRAWDDISYLDESIKENNLTFSKIYHYTEIDSDKKLNLILNHFQSSPSYEPRKSVRESYESLPFAEAYFKVNDKEELKFLVKFLFKNGYKHFGGMRVDINSYPTYIFTRFDNKNISYLEDEDDYTILEYVKDYSNINPKTFNYKDILQLDSIEKTGNLQVIPNYNPRKIDRTLEGVEYWPYRFKTEKELLDDYGSGWRRIVFNELSFTFTDEMNYLLGQDVKMELPKNWRVVYYPSVREVFGRIIWSIAPEFITKNKPKAPSYEPRKMDRTLEKRNSFEDACEVCMVLNNIDDLNKLKEEVESLPVPYRWPNISGLEFPFYIFVNLVNRDITHASELDMIRHLGADIDMTKSEFFNNVYYKPYTMKNLKHFLKILQDRKITHFPIEVPSYEPRKMDRTLESISSSYKYSVVIFKTLNQEQSSYVQEELFKQGYEWRNTHDTIKNFNDNDYPVYFFAKHDVGNITYMSPYELINYGDGTINDYMIHYKERGNNVCPTVFDYKSTSDVDNLMKYGVPAPSYKPKKIDRTLESFNVKDYPYNGIAFRVNGKSDVVKIISWFHNEYGIERNTDLNTIIEEVDEVFYGDYDKNCLVVFLARNNFGILSPNNFKDYKISDKIYSVRDLGEFGLKPSYEPKKIERTLESSLYSDYPYDSIVIRINNKDDLNTTKRYLGKYQHYDSIYFSMTDKFQHSDKPLYIRINIYHNEEEENWCLTKGSIDYLLSSGMDITYEKIFSVGDLRNGLLDNFIKFGKTISNPSYQPRRTERTLEQNSLLESNNPMDVSKSKYFTQYNTLVFSVTTEDKDTDIRLFLENVKKIFHNSLYDSSIRDIILKKLKNRTLYVRATFIEHDFDWGYSDLDRFPKMAEEANYTFKRIFSFNEVNNNLNNILRHGDMIPSYEPKKIERTLESNKYYPYRFKTEQEFINAFGEDWNDVISERGPNWAGEEMNHLFGVDFPFEQRQLNPKEDDYPINGRWDDPNSHQDWSISWDMLTPNEPQTPSYAPRKIDRTLESTKWYPYRFKTEEECKNEFGDNWPWDCYPEIGWNEEMTHLLGKDFPYLENELELDNQKADKSEDRLPLGKTRFIDEYGKDWLIGWDMLIKNKPNTPSYVPKRIVRTLESVNEKEYSYLLVQVENETEVDKVLYMLGSISPELIGNNYSMEYPNWIRIVSKKIDGKYQRALRWYNESIPKTVLDYIEKNPNTVDPKIYTVKDLQHIKSLITGKPYKPSYEPRMMDRTLESKLSDKDAESLKDKLSKGRYTCINFGFYNEIEAQKIQTYLDNLEFINTTDRLQCSQGGNIRCKTIFTIENDSFDSFIVYGSGDGSHMEDGSFAMSYPIYTISPIFTPDELIRYIESYRAPNYEPKRIVRTLEKFHEKYKYESIVVAIHSMDEMVEARKYLGKFTNYDAIYQDFIEKGFERGGYYIRINENNYRVGQHLTYSSLVHLEPANFNTNSYEKLLTIQDLRRGALDNIFRMGSSQLTPIYEPRKFDKTFEKFNNKYKHEGLIIKVNNSEESQKIQELLFENEIPWGSGHLTPMYLRWNFPDYLTVTLGNYFGHPQISHGPKPGLSEFGDINMDWNVYTIKDYDTIRNILKYGKPTVKPSYEPRKMDRTLEAVGYKRYYNNQLGQPTNWPYRFKTRKEFNDTCSRFGGDWSCGRFLFVLDMSFLFGTNLEYDYPDGVDFIDINRNGGWHVTKEMLVKNELAKPNYEPKQTSRDI